MTFESDDLINKATGYRNKRLENKKALLNKQRAYKKNSHARPDTQKSTHKSPEKTSTGLRSFKDFEAQWKASGRQNTGTSTQTGTTAKQTSQHTGVTKFSDFEKRWNAEHGPQNVSVTKDADLLDALDDTDTGYLEDAHSKMLDQKYGVEKLNETDLLADLDELDDDLDNISDDSYLTNAHTPKYSV
ncbi:hypothetical protein E1178_03970 [Roseibium hamelinense]|nr:hypothetical protein [Roseibium hamelinense]MTI42758.1 hypothetical protein [Roseibium hamelinense]